MRNTKAFTLVELIVVITILAILGTIAFISLQGYSADARNSKRTTDISSIKSTMDLSQVNGIWLMSLLTPIATNKVDAANISLSWLAAPTTAQYDAGTPAYTVLGISSDDFKDPNDIDYIIGATTLNGWSFQVASTLVVDSIPTAKLVGTYVARSVTGHAGSSSKSIFTFTNNSSANYFSAGDSVDIANATANGLDVQVLKVSSDGMSLTLDITEADLTNGNSVSLATLLGTAGAEMAGLIRADAGTSTWVAVTELSTISLPY